MSLKLARPFEPPKGSPDIDAAALDAALEVTGGLGSVLQTLGKARRAQSRWAELSVGLRLGYIRKLKHLIAERPEIMAQSIDRGASRTLIESLTAEVLPVADACAFLEREAERVLRPRRLGRQGRPMWLSGVETTITREPLGVVLVIAPGNYPLMLPTIQALQALAAGNAVLVKPAPGGTGPMACLGRWLDEVGLYEGLFTVLPEDVGPTCDLMKAGVDKVVLTGSADTGRAVLADLHETLTPSVMELSGCDAAFVRSGADVKLVARALAFGLKFNGSATCIAPRRVFCAYKLAKPLVNELVNQLRDTPAVDVGERTARQVHELVDDAIAAGATLATGSGNGSLDQPGSGPANKGKADPAGPTHLRPIVIQDASPAMRIMKEDVFAPVIAITACRDASQALADAALCPYALGATVFGPEDAARQLARKVKAGVVVVNDMIVPTADPRVPFGGRGQSGFGVTRGAEGLLEMTAIKSVAVRKGTFLPHLDEPQPGDEVLFSEYIRLTHGINRRVRLQSLGRLLQHLWRRFRYGRVRKPTPEPSDTAD